MSTIVKTNIISGATTDTNYGYDSNSKIYRIKISWNKTQNVLGITHNENISFNYAAFDDSISNRESSDGIKFSDEQKAYLASNILLHETVHSIYGHNSSWYSGLTQHESTGLMVGFRWLDWFFPSFYDANPDSDKKLLPFSSTTQNRLKAAIRK